MKKYIIIYVIVFGFALMSLSGWAQTNTSKDSTGVVSVSRTGGSIKADAFQIGKDTLYVSVLGHGSLMFEYLGKMIYVDPYSKVCNYGRLPKADLILITHEHPDHLDEQAIDRIKKGDTRFMMSEVCNQTLGYGEILMNGNKTQWENISIETMPAYNIQNLRANGDAYHPKGRGNGYILTFDNMRVYVAGDTESIPEMKKLKGTIAIAFLPKNMPYTMDDRMFVDAAKKLMPTYLYPYHFSEFDEASLTKQLAGTNIKLLVRPMSNK